jgi:hypothetical protein
MDFSAKMWREIPGVIWHHVKEGNINYPMTTFSITMHFLAVKGFMVAHECKAETLLFAWVLSVLW